MRVVAGRLGGRRLRPVPGRRTRPTPDRVREALFGILAEGVSGARVVDLFAGTGALAVEALSRGASSAVLVERAAAAVATIRANLGELGLDEVATVRRSTVEAWLRGRRDGPFDLALLDPPYDLPVGTLVGVLAGLPGVLAPGATVVLEASSRAEPPPWPPGLVPAPPRRYGDTSLHIAIYRPEGAEVARSR